MPSLIDEHLNTANTTNSAIVALIQQDTNQKEKEDQNQQEEQQEQQSQPEPQQQQDEQQDDSITGINNNNNTVDTTNSDCNVVIKNNNYYYYLDSSMRPHLNNNNNNKTSNTNNMPADSTLNTTGTIPTNNKLIMFSNHNNNNNNQLNCIDLDLYDYLTRKCKLSTFTLWNLTASPTTTTTTASTSTTTTIQTTAITSPSPSISTTSTTSTHTTTTITTNPTTTTSATVTNNKRASRKTINIFNNENNNSYLNKKKILRKHSLGSLDMLHHNNNNNNSSSNNISQNYLSNNFINSRNYNQHQKPNLAIFKCLNKNLINSLLMNFKLDKELKRKNLLIDSDREVLTGTTIAATTTTTTTTNCSSSPLSSSSTSPASSLYNLNTTPTLSPQATQTTNVNTFKSLHLAESNDIIKNLLIDIILKVESIENDNKLIELKKIFENELNNRKASLFGDENYIKQVHYELFDKNFHLIQDQEQQQQQQEQENNHEQQQQQETNIKIDNKLNQVSSLVSSLITSETTPNLTTPSSSMLNSKSISRASTSSSILDNTDSSSSSSHDDDLVIISDLISSIITNIIEQSIYDEHNTDSSLSLKTTTNLTTTNITNEINLLEGINEKNTNPSHSTTTSTTTMDNVDHKNENTKEDYDSNKFLQEKTPTNNLDLVIEKNKITHKNYENNKNNNNSDDINKSKNKNNELKGELDINTQNYVDLNNNNNNHTEEEKEGNFEKKINLILNNNNDDEFKNMIKTDSNLLLNPNFKKPIHEELLNCRVKKFTYKNNEFVLIENLSDDDDEEKDYVIKNENAEELIFDDSVKILKKTLKTPILEINRVVYSSVVPPQVESPVISNDFNKMHATTTSSKLDPAFVSSSLPKFDKKSADTVDDNDPCIKAALERFDAFCKSKCQTKAPTSNKKTSTSTSSSTSDYSGFIKRRQARIEKLLGSTSVSPSTPQPPSSMIKSESDLKDVLSERQDNKKIYGSQDVFLDNPKQVELNNKKVEGDNDKVLSSNVDKKSIDTLDKQNDEKLNNSFIGENEKDYKMNDVMTNKNEENINSIINNNSDYISEKVIEKNNNNNIEIAEPVKIEDKIIVEEKIEKEKPIVVTTPTILPEPKIESKVSASKSSDYKIKKPTVAKPVVTSSYTPTTTTASFTTAASSTSSTITTPAPIITPTPAKTMYESSYKTETFHEVPKETNKTNDTKPMVNNEGKRVNIIPLKVINSKSNPQTPASASSKEKQAFFSSAKSSHESTPTKSFHESTPTKSSHESTPTSVLSSSPWQTKSTSSIGNYNNDLAKSNSNSSNSTIIRDDNINYNPNLAKTSSMSSASSSSEISKSENYERIIPIEVKNRKQSDNTNTYTSTYTPTTKQSPAPATITTPTTTTTSTITTSPRYSTSSNDKYEVKISSIKSDISPSYKHEIKEDQPVEEKQILIETPIIKPDYLETKYDNLENENLQSEYLPNDFTENDYIQSDYLDKDEIENNELQNYYQNEYNKNYEPYTTYEYETNTDNDNDSGYKYSTYNYDNKYDTYKPYYGNTTVSTSQYTPHLTKSVTSNDDENDPIAERACNNFMYKLMEYQRQRQHQYPTSSTLTSSYYSSRPSYSDTSYSSYSTPITYTTTTTATYTSPSSYAYKHSLSNPGDLDHGKYESRFQSYSDGFGLGDQSSSTTSLDKPYVSSIRKRRTLMSENGGIDTATNRIYSTPLSSASSYYSSHLNERDSNVYPQYTSPTAISHYMYLNSTSVPSSYSTSPYSNYNSLTTTTLTNTFSTTTTTTTAITSTTPTTTTISAGYSQARNRPLSIVNEETNSLNTSLPQTTEATTTKRLIHEKARSEIGDIRKEPIDSIKKKTSATTDHIGSRTHSNGYSLSTTANKTSSDKPITSQRSKSLVKKLDLKVNTGSSSSNNNSNSDSSSPEATNASVFTRLSKPTRQTKLENPIQLSGLVHLSSKESSTSPTSTSPTEFNSSSAPLSSARDTTKSGYMSKYLASSHVGQNNDNKTNGSTYQRLRSVETKTRDVKDARKEPVRRLSNTSTKQTTPPPVQTVIVRSPEVEVPVKIETTKEHSIPITIEPKVNKVSIQSSNNMTSQVNVNSKKPPPSTTYAFGSSIPVTRVVESNNSTTTTTTKNTGPDPFERLTKKTTSMKNLSTNHHKSQNNVNDASNFTDYNQNPKKLNGRSTSINNYGFSLLANERESTPPSEDLDVQTHLNTNLNQSQAKPTVLNVFERLYKGATNNPTQKNSSGTGHYSDNESSTAQSNAYNMNIPQKQLKKNISVSTASLSSSTTSGSNHAGISPPQSTIVINQPQQQHQQQKIQDTPKLTKTRPSVFDRLAGNASKTPKATHLKSNTNLINNHEDTKSTPSSPINSKNENYIDSTTNQLKSASGYNLNTNNNSTDQQTVLSDTENQITNENSQSTASPVHKPHKKTSITNRIKESEPMGTRSSQEIYNKEALAEKDVKFLTSSTHFNNEDVISFHKAFIKHCPSGQIKRKEFTKMFKEFQPAYADTDKADLYCEYLFNAFDTDKSGYITFHELLLALSVTTFGDIREKIQLAFRIFDLDKNNRIDRKEMCKVIGSLYDIAGIPEEMRVEENSPMNRVDGIMKQLDINNDNVISIDEFIDGCLADELVRQFLINPLFTHNHKVFQ